MSSLDGILLVDKPEGPTSQTVVTKVKRALGASKAGHTGTLDPFATGLLVVCLGRATKLAGVLTTDDKEYRATVRFGSATDTDDATGREIARSDASALERTRVEEALGKFRGAIRQVPPAFSAIQKDGERMYERARRGDAVALEPRDCVVHTLTCESFTPGEAPEAMLAMRVSKGTYVRALARDLGEALGTHAHLRALRRTAAGAFRVADAVPLDAVTTERLVPLDRIPLPIPELTVTAEEAARLAHGIRPAVPPGAGDGPRALRAPDGRLLALATLAGGRLALDRVL